MRYQYLQQLKQILMYVGRFLHLKNFYAFYLFYSYIINTGLAEFVLSYYSFTWVKELNLYLYFYQSIILHKHPYTCLIVVVATSHKFRIWVMMMMMMISEGQWGIMEDTDLLSIY